MNTFGNRGQYQSLTLISVSHISIGSNYQVSFNDEFDGWPVYSGERIGASLPSCSPIL